MSIYNSAFYLRWVPSSPITLSSPSSWACCPFLGVSKKLDTAVGMGAAVTFVMGLASAVSPGW